MTAYAMTAYAMTAYAPLHEYHLDDLVSDGTRRGDVVDEHALYVTVRWEDGREEEVEQFHPRILVELRALDRPEVACECEECDLRQSWRVFDPRDWEDWDDDGTGLCARCAEWDDDWTPEVAAVGAPARHRQVVP